MFRYLFGLEMQTGDSRPDHPARFSGMRCPRVMLVACLALALVLAGCAGIDVTTIGTDAARDASARGFRYYQSAPFLFVASDGKGGVTGVIKFLPDTTQKMSIRPYAFASSNETTLTFDGGVLSGASTVVDETTVPSAALDALAKVLTAAARASLAAPDVVDDATVPVPYLFRIVQKGDTIELRGGPLDGAALDPDGTRKMIIRVTIARAGG
jgi:hypothetical protein